jgi:2-polyprenyl-6-methoxyphenol hydroxylase-like FAD-dependent oxidoreductase
LNPGRRQQAELNRTIHNDASSIRDTEVLIVGAGPTGLVCARHRTGRAAARVALWLTPLGRSCEIVDQKTAEAGTASRALAVQARRLELYRQIGIAEAVVERVRRVVAANLWVTGQRIISQMAVS